MTAVTFRFSRIDGRWQVVVSRRIPVRPATAWAVLRDTETWPVWGPSIRGVETDVRYVEAGTSGTLHLPGGCRVPFTVETCANRRWDWRVAGVRATGHRVESLGEVSDREDERDGSRVCFGVPLWAAPYGLFCWIALGRIEALALDRAAPRYESG